MTFYLLCSKAAVAASPPKGLEPPRKCEVLQKTTLRGLSGNASRQLHQKLLITAPAGAGKTSGALSTSMTKLSS
jgi:hypothetical protein